MSTGLEMRGAMAAASHLELLRGELGIDIRIPMFCTIDHLGYRLLAMPLMPLGPDTLIYGSVCPACSGLCMFCLSCRVTEAAPSTRAPVSVLTARWQSWVKNCTLLSIK